MATFIGTSGDDRLRGTSDNDIFESSAGNDTIDAGKGNDTAIFTLSENIGFTNVYHGRQGVDTLRINLTSEEFTEDLRLKLLDLQAFIAANSDPLQRKGPTLEFSFGVTDAAGNDTVLILDAWKALEIIVDGEEVDLTDPVTAAPVDDLSGVIWTLTGDLSVTEEAAGGPTYTVGYSGVTLAAGQTVSIDLGITLPGGVGGAEAEDFVSSFFVDVDAALPSGVTRSGSTLIFDETAPSSVTFSLPIFDDSIPDDGEIFTVSISSPSIGSISGTGSVTTTIHNQELGDEFQVNTFTAKDQKDPTAAGLSDGGYVIVWESSDQDGSGKGVFGQRFDANGDPVGGEFPVNT